MDSAYVKGNRSYPLMNDGVIMKSNNTVQNTIPHAITTFKRRFGITLTTNDLETITANIYKSSYNNVGSDNHIEFWRAKVKDTDTVIVFDSIKQHIVTFLYPRIAPKRYRNWKPL